MARKLSLKVSVVKYNGRCSAEIRNVDTWVSKSGNPCLVVRLNAMTPMGNTPVTGWIRLDSPVLGVFLNACGMQVKENMDIDLDSFTGKKVDVELTWNEEYATHNVQRWFRNTEAPEDSATLEEGGITTESEEDDDDTPEVVSEISDEEEDDDELIPF